MTSGVVFLTAITSTTTGNIVRWGQGAAWPVQWAGVTIQAATGNLAAATAATAPLPETVGEPGGSRGTHTPDCTKTQS